MSTSSEPFSTLADGKWLTGSPDTWLKVTASALHWLYSVVYGAFENAGNLVFEVISWSHSC